MTVITKALGEKAKAVGDNMEQPLVVENTTDESPVDPEAQNPKKDFVIRKRYLILRNNALRPSAMTTLGLFLVVSGIGIIGGVYIYRLYARDQLLRYHSSYYNIPYDISNTANQEEMIRLIDHNAFFKERFDIDLENGLYEKIDVPDFHGGRQGRFIHDFNINKTGIVDIDGGCCFVMPLNRQRVLRPRNMYDLLKKMYNGYYEVDTEVVRETMQVVTPAITDLSSVGTYIARECQNMMTYMLVPVKTIVHKRSTGSGVYGQFAGNKIVELNIINLESILEENKK